MAGLSEELCLTTTAVRVEVVQGVARDVTLAIPAGLVVDQVNGSTVGDWEASGGLLRFGSSGTGTFNSFVRVQGTPTEQGYNTNGTLQFDTKTGNWTKAILVSGIPVTYIGGVPYWELFVTPVRVDRH